MTHDEALRSLEAGIELVESLLPDHPPDVVAVGEMGIANTTAASALISVITKTPPEETTGRGTGIDDAQRTRKIELIRKALEKHKPDPDDPLDCLSKVGGFEIGGIAGIFLACARHQIPVITDGLISTAGCLIAARLKPEAKDYLFSSHLSCEEGHPKALSALEQTAIFDLKLRLGEGTGAVLAMGILDCAARIMSEMATFEDAGVSRKKN